MTSSHESLATLERTNKTCKKHGLLCPSGSLRCGNLSMR